MKPNELLRDPLWFLWLVAIFIQIYVGGMILKLTWIAYTGEQGYGPWIACGHWNIYGEGYTELILVFINIAVAVGTVAYWGYRTRRAWERRERRTSPQG